MAPARAAALGKAVQRIRTDVSDIDLRWLAAATMARAIPSFRGAEVRTALLRLAGWTVGKGTVLMGWPRVFGPGSRRRDMEIGAMGAINIGCTFELYDRIVLGENVSVGPDVTILTSSHHLGSRGKRAGTLFTAPVTVGDGVWLGAGCILLPGVTVGAGAVVAAQAVVNKDVPDNALVAGAPATVAVRRLPG